METTTVTIGYWLILVLAWFGVIAWDVYIWFIPVEKQRQISMEIIKSNKYLFAENKKYELELLESPFFLWRMRIGSILLTLTAIIFTIIFLRR